MFKGWCCFWDIDSMIRPNLLRRLKLEHVEEVYVEQAFVNYNLGNNVNLRGGLMLVPMGIINEFHEPTTFNGTERPAMDNVIVPTTWRELGVGVFGRVNDLSLGYQAYIFNGFKSTEADGEGGFHGVFYKVLADYGAEDKKESNLPLIAQLYPPNWIIMEFLVCVWDSPDILGKHRLPMM